MRRKTAVVAVPLALLLALAALGWMMLVPTADPRPLPPDLVALETTEGRALLSGAESGADYPPLARTFQTQALKSYCGVASAVAVLSALGVETSQSGFFTPEALEVRARWRVVLTGMPLDDLAGLIAAHGADVAARHADSFDEPAFREALAANLDRPDDYMIVNYQREVLGQDPTGHISPVAAYDAETDRVLVMDTASYKYPLTWVPVSALYAAMRTVDGETGAYRGYVEVAAGR